MDREELAKEKAEVKRKKALAAEIEEDFERRRIARKPLENGWRLNMCFLSGDQYCDVSPYGDIVAEEKKFYWQARRVFNHIAPTVDARMSKLVNLRPALKVRAFSDEDGDIQAAKLASGVLEYAQDRIDFSEVVSKVTLWAEVCGSAFYKVTWNEQGGRMIGKREDGSAIFEGEVCVSSLSPFEIFPDRLDAENIEELRSIIHAQAVPRGYIFEKFGVAIPEQEHAQKGLNTYSQPANDLFGAGAKEEEFDGVILIERYTSPNAEFPQGKLEIAAGGELLYEGVLPYLCGDKNERALPFVKQDCMRLPGAFFGCSIIDRLIPVQRAYNAVRNRKHEFLNRLALGIVAVEDGSVDSDDLIEEGLAPGKVLVYRQGSKAPEVLEIGGMPDEFAKEEEWLEKEFSFISGVSDLSQSSTAQSVTSATGLQLLLSQDDSRLSATVDSMERAMKEVGKQILRLYRQFAGAARLMTLTGENKKTQIFYFNANQLSTADIKFVSEEAASPSEKKQTLLKLFEAGLFTDEDGKISKAHKNRILDAFGYGNEENARDISALHLARAAEENIKLLKQDLQAEEFDDHELHILEHTRYLLSSAFEAGGNEDGKQRIVEHMRKHKAMKNQ